MNGKWSDETHLRVSKRLFRVVRSSDIIVIHHDNSDHWHDDAPCAVSLAARLKRISTPRRPKSPRLQPPSHHLHRHAHPANVALAGTTCQSPLLSPRIHRRPPEPHARATVQASPRTSRRVQPPLLDRRTSPLGSRFVSLTAVLEQHAVRSSQAVRLDVSSRICLA